MWSRIKGRLALDAVLQTISAPFLLVAAFSAYSTIDPQAARASTSPEDGNNGILLRASDNFVIHGWDVSCSGSSPVRYGCGMSKMVGDLGAFHVIFLEDTIIVRRPICDRSGEREELEFARTGSFRVDSIWVGREASLYASNCLGTQPSEFINFMQTVTLLYYASR